MLHGLVISAAPGDGNRQSVDGVAAPAVVASPHEAAATAATAAATDADGSPLRVRTIADIADSVGQSHDKNQSLAASSCSRCSLPRSPSIYPSAARFYFCFPPVTRLCSRFLSLSLSRARSRWRLVCPFVRPLPERTEIPACVLPACDSGLPPLRYVRDALFDVVSRKFGKIMTRRRDRRTRKR